MDDAVGARVAETGCMSRQRGSSDDIRGLIEQIDGLLREAERLRSYADERNRRTPFWPERRKMPRIPQERASEHDTSDSTP